MECFISNFHNFVEKTSKLVWDFFKISLFLKILNLNSFGKLSGNSYILSFGVNSSFLFHYWWMEIALNFFSMIAVVSAWFLLKVCVVSSHLFSCLFEKNKCFGKQELFGLANVLNTLKLVFLIAWNVGRILLIYSKIYLVVV